MITPENNNKQEHNHNEEEPKKTVYKETEETEDLNAGDTSSIGDSGRSAFVKKPGRTNKPLGSSHEPGVIPGREF